MTPGPQNVFSLVIQPHLVCTMSALYTRGHGFWVRKHLVKRQPPGKGRQKGSWTSPEKEVPEEKPSVSPGWKPGQSFCTCTRGRTGLPRPGPLGLSAGMAFITEGDPFNELSAFGAGL